MKKYIFISFIFFYACISEKNSPTENPYIMVLGIAQDAGYPQINCQKDCCKNAWKNPSLQKFTSCLAIIDPATKQQWIIDATPNIKNQLHLLKKQTGKGSVDGVLLTHAHIGHYTGLIHFGKEVMGANKIPVFAMPKMKKFLKRNGPWSQLVEFENIRLQELKSDSIFNLNKDIKVKPFLVPHRDEFSETVGYEIKIKNKILIFIPDIDKWEKWNTDINSLIKKVDYAFLDGTFYKNGELKRDMREIPHPFVEESMQLFFELPKEDKKKVHFIHFNHTNPLLIKGSADTEEVIKKGFSIAEQGQVIKF